MENLIMVSILIPLFEAMTQNQQAAYRTVCLVPAMLALATGIFLHRNTDDTPRGNYKDLKKEDPAWASRRPLACLFVAFKNPNTWILALQYGCCFGLELIVNSLAVVYFEEEFGVSPEAAAAIGNIFGWLEFFARPLGGIASDLANARWGMRGRLWVQAATLLLEGALILVLASCSTLMGSVAVLVLFSLLVKAAKGSTFAVVPYVSPPATGSVMGLTSAGGVAGAVAFDAVFRAFDDNNSSNNNTHNHRQALVWTGVIVMGCSLLTCMITIAGHRSLLGGVDRHVDPETGIVVVVVVVARSRGGSSKASGSEAGSSHRGGPDEPGQCRSA
jgi:MFS transporter, NNP family, nitrate/nitrite transporter